MGRILQSPDARMTERPRRAKTESSKGYWLLRWAVPALIVAGALLLIVAEFTPLLDVRIKGSGVVLAGSTRRTGGHHSYALLPIAVLALVMAVGAARGARAAAAAVVVLGLLAAGIALLHDAPDIGKPGDVTTFERGITHAQAGIYLETGGAAVLIVAGGAALILAAAPRPQRRQARGPTPDSTTNA
jgi:hypothetical protein